MRSLRALAVLGALVTPLSACDGKSDAKPAQPAGSAPAGTTTAKPSPAARTGDPRTDPFEIKVAHILYSYKGAQRSKTGRTKEQAYALAQDAIEQLQKGRPFSELVVLTDDLSSDGRPNGMNGEVGTYVVRRGGGFAKGFEDAGYATPVGQVAPKPVETEFGYHVILRVK